MSGLGAVICGWLAVRQILEVQKIKRETTGVTAWLTNWNTKDGFRAEVGLDPGDPEKKVWVAMSHDVGLRLFGDVDVYLHPTDPEKSRLGGLFQFWLGPAVLLLTAVVFALPAVWLLSLSGPAHYAHPLPGDWAGRWVWFSAAPWPGGAGYFVLRLPSYAWKVASGLALVGTPFIYHAIADSAALWHGRLLWGVFGLFWTLVLGGVSLHFGSYELVADERSVRERSALGWKQAPWEAVRRLEDESVRYQRWSETFQRFEPGLSDSGRRALVLVDADGKRMTRIGVELEPPSARRKLFEYARQRTGLTPVDTERRVVR